MNAPVNYSVQTPSEQLLTTAKPTTRFNHESIQDQFRALNRYHLFASDTFNSFTAAGGRRSHPDRFDSGYRLRDTDF